MPTPKSVTVKASLVDQFKMESQVREHAMIVDQPEGGGGNNAGPNPLEYYFLALAGCIGTVARIIAKQRRFELRGVDVELQGEADLDRLMGKETEQRAGFKSINAIVTIDADMTDEEKTAYLKEIDARCPISDNIINATPVNFKLNA